MSALLPTMHRPTAYLTPRLRAMLLPHHHHMCPTTHTTITCRHMSRMPNKNDKKNMKVKASVKAKQLQHRATDLASLGDNGADLLTKLKFTDIEAKMHTYVQNMQTALANIQVGRAAPTALDAVTITLPPNNTRHRLSDLAQISVRTANTVHVQLHDHDMVKYVESAIRQYNDDLNPQYDSATQSILVPFPKVTRVTRDRLIKQVQKRADETRVHVRGVRQEAVNKTRSVLKDASRDDVEWIKGEVQALTDECLLDIDQIVKQKEKELND